MKFFHEFTNEQSLWFLIFNLGSFLIGLVAAWLANRAKIAKLQVQITDLHAEKNRLISANKELTEKDMVAQTELVRLREELDNTRNLKRQVEAEKGQLYADNMAMQTEVENTQKAMQLTAEELYALKNTLKDGDVSAALMQEIDALRSKLSAYEQGLPEGTHGEVDFINNPVGDVFDDAMIKTSQLVEEGNVFTANPETLIADPELVERSIQEDLMKLEADSRDIDAPAPGGLQIDSANEANLKSIFNAVEIDTNFAEDMPDDARDIDEDEDSIQVSSPEELTAQHALLAKLGNVSPDQADDLKAIVGVGPVLEKKLHDHGIYTFEQIMNLDAETLDLIKGAMGSLADRIEREDWIGQARTLYANKQN